MEFLRVMMRKVAKLVPAILSLLWWWDALGREKRSTARLAVKCDQVAFSNQAIPEGSNLAM